MKKEIRMSHLLQIGECGYRPAKCCGMCEHCQHYDSGEWVETHCISNEGKMIEMHLLGVCDKYEDRKDLNADD